MEEDVLTALRSRAVYLPGCFDRDGRALVVVNMPADLQPWNRKCLEVCINYIRKSLSAKTLRNGLTVILDGQKLSSRVTRSQCRIIGSLFDDNLAHVFLLRAEGFWDKHVDHCAKNHNQKEPIVITKSRLSKYFDMAELPEELGGSVVYNHDRWLQNRVRIEEFRAKYEKTTDDVDHLHIMLLDQKLVRPGDASQAIAACEQRYISVQLAISAVIEMGNKLTVNISDSYRLPGKGDLDFNKIPQDIIGELERITDLLNEIERKQSAIRCTWSDFEKNVHDARELSALEERVAFITNWILGTGEKIQNRQLCVGYDVASCEKFRQEHALLEMQCMETYDLYTELSYKVDMYSSNRDSFAYKDLQSKRTYMDFVCRNFALRLEQRRNLLNSSSRFFQLVSEYFDKTSEVFETLVMGNSSDDLDEIASTIQKLKDSQGNLERIEKDLMTEGKILSDMLAISIKNARGRDINVSYSDDIANVRDILDATIARRNIFIDSVELHKLTLEHIAHIYQYEKDARLAIKWMDELYETMVCCHSHVASNVYEIQIQKAELQSFQETGKGIYLYGCQLVETSETLRQSCKLETDVVTGLSKRLRQTWSNLQSISQENMMRLRVSSVFHRSIEEHCSKLHELESRVIAINDIDKADMRRVRLRKYLTLREHLLVEVGRMVRLGHLLKTRLKEAFVLKKVSTSSGAQNDDTTSSTDNLEGSATTVFPAGGNSAACNAISTKLCEVSEAAESLDAALKSAESSLDNLEENLSISEKKFDHNRSSSADDWTPSIRSTEDESYATAADDIPHLSESSSYQTASEHITSPWWSSEKGSMDDCSEISNGTSTTPQTSGIMSANASFDSNDGSLRNTQRSTTNLEKSRPEMYVETGKMRRSASSDSTATVTSNESHYANINGFAMKEDLIPKDPVPEVRISKTVMWSAGHYQNINVTKQAIKGCI